MLKNVRFGLALAIFAAFSFYIAAQAIWAKASSAKTRRPSAAELQKPAPADAATAALSPFVDVHVHMAGKDPNAAIADAVIAMHEENASKLVFLPSPYTVEDTDRFDAELFRDAVKAHPDQLAFLGG